MSEERDPSMTAENAQAQPKQLRVNGVLAHMLQMFDGVVHGFAHVVDTVPGAAGLAALVRAMRADAARLRQMVAPPPPMPEPAPEPDAADPVVEEATSDETLAIDAAALDKAEAKADKKAERYASSKS